MDQLFNFLFELCSIFSWILIVYLIQILPIKDSVRLDSNGTSPNVHFTKRHHKCQQLQKRVYFNQK